MATLKVIVTVVYILICIALIVVVLMQEGKSAGLAGALNGTTDTYWSRNKGRSMEGTLVKLTRIFAVLFLIGSVVLNLKW